jgi:hypothetical protein
LDSGLLASHPEPHGKPSATCAADVHGVLGSALEMLDTAICDPASGVLAFDAPISQASEADGA